MRITKTTTSQPARTGARRPAPQGRSQTWRSRPDPSRSVSTGPKRATMPKRTVKISHRSSQSRSPKTSMPASVRTVYPAASPATTFGSAAKPEASSSQAKPK